jgi:hypothetical protein
MSLQPWWHRITIRDLIALIFTSTICGALLLTLSAMVIFGPERIPESARANLGELATFILGMLSGYLLGRPNNHSPPTSR